MTPPVFIGIDPTAGKRPLNYAVLDADLAPLVLAGTGTQDELIERVLAYPSAMVAVDAPQSPNGGLMASDEYRARLSPPPAPGRWLRFKVCEYLLKQRGIGLYNTPNDEAALPSWMRLGFELYAALRAAGYQRYQPNSRAPRQVMEVHPHACFTVLLGHTPTPKDLLEGRLQRQLVLYRAGLAVPDPMSALEEITAHHLLTGKLILPDLLSHDALDALAAAYTAYLAGTAPDQVTPIGDPDEGQIVLPIAPAALKAQYSRTS